MAPYIDPRDPRPIIKCANLEAHNGTIPSWKGIEHIDRQFLMATQFYAS